MELEQSSIKIHGSWKLVNAIGCITYYFFLEYDILYLIIEIS